MGRYQEITPKEWAIAGVVGILAIALSIFFYPFVRDGMMKKITIYQNALQLDSAAEFSLSEKTQEGAILAYGEMVPTESVTFPELITQYAMLSRIHEHYTMHTYTTENCTGTGNSRVCTTEIHTYWSWDYDGQENVSTPSFKFLGVDFEHGSLNLEPFQTVTLSDAINPTYNEHKVAGNYIYVTGDDRYYFRDVPLKVAGTMFVSFVEEAHNPINPRDRIEFSVGSSIEDVIKYQNNMMKAYTVLYYILVFVFIVTAYLVWAYEIGDIE